MSSLNIKEYTAAARKAYAETQGNANVEMLQAGGTGTAIDPVMIQVYYMLDRTEGNQTVDIFKQDKKNQGHFIRLGHRDDGNIFKPGGSEVTLTENGASGTVTVSAPVLANVAADLGSDSSYDDVTINQVGFNVGTVLY